MGHNELPEIEAQIAKNREARAVNENEGEALDIECGHLLNKGRAKFPGKENDRAFGEWVKEMEMRNELLHIDRPDRAAFMWAAENTNELARMRVEHPKVPTLRGLHDKFKAEKKPKVESKTKKKAEPKSNATNVQTALNAITSGTDEGVDRDAVAAALPDGKKHVDQTIAPLLRDGQVIEVKNRYYDADFAPTTEVIEAPKSVKDHKARLERQFEKRVSVESQIRAQAWLAEHQLPLMHKRLAKVERLILRRDGVMSKKEYQTILKALHPDRGGNAEAFQIFRETEIALTDGKTNPKPGGLDIQALRESLAV